MDLKISTSALIMMLLMVVIVILLIAVIAKTYEAKEKFGSLMRYKLLSKASMKGTSRDETEADLETQGESINQKESYTVSRGNLLFEGDFDYLLNGKKDKPSFRQSDKSIVEEIGDTVKEKIQQVTEQVSDSNIAVDSSVPTELSEPEQEAAPEVQPEYETKKVEETAETVATEPELEQKDDVISNSGNSIESTSPESFGLSRIYNNFEILKSGTTASEIAQNEDPSNEQKSTDMLEYIKKMML